MPNARMNILVVDDDAALRMTLSHILGSFGHVVRCAADGFAALSEIRLAIPDIILSDLNMPGMSGFEFLSVVRRRFPAIRVIAMSSAFPVDGLPPGVVADAFYQKGNNLAKLFHIMETLTGSQQPPSFNHARTPAPIWVERNGHDMSGGAFVMLTCPECLRTFPQVFADALNPVHETGCIYCDSRFHYAIVQPTDPAPRKVSDQKKAVSRYLPRERQAQESM